MWIVIIFIIIVIPYLIWQDNGIATTKFDYKNKKIPKKFDGFKIVQIADLHNKKFGNECERLLKKIEEAEPDIIVVTGDLIDRRRYDLDTAMKFINGAIKICPIYYVPGNHEGWSNIYESIENELKKAGVKALSNESTELDKDDEKIKLIGLKDPAFWTERYHKKTDTSLMVKYLDTLPQNDEFKIVLSHRPELFELYASYNLDLIFTGHAHGGQFRVPFIGGLYAPNQGVFPRYTSGEHVKDDTTMIISRGLGNSRFPIRLNNRPEIIVLTLMSE